MNQSTFKSEIALIQQLTGIEDEDLISFNNDGWTSRVYLINKGEIVFKFPKYSRVIEEYRQEVRMYQLLTNADLPVSFPQPKWIHPQYQYIGYRGVSGVCINQIINNLSHQEKERIGDKLKVFIHGFHLLSLTNAPKTNLQADIQKTQYSFVQNRQLFIKFFSDTQLNRLDHFVNFFYPTKLLQLGYQPCLCHGDLGFWNMIYDQGSLGIIDFGDVGYYDESIDYAGLTDPDIFNLVTKDEDSILIAKAQLRMQATPLLDLPYYVKTDNQAETKISLDRISLTLQQLSN